MNSRERRQARAMACLFPVALIYYELVFRIFTVGGIFRARTLLVLPFCFAYGVVGYLLCTISKNRRVNYFIALALLLLTAIPFGVEAFVYREFKIFFSVRAIVAQTGDVAKRFSGEVFRLIFSFRGILCILLFLLPSALYLFAGQAPAPIDGRTRAMAAARAVSFYVLSVLVIQTAPVLSRLYGEEYSFNAAVEQFGFLTGVQLDARESLFGRGTFQEVDMAAVLAAPEAGAVPETGAVPENGAAPGTEAALAPTAVPTPTAEPVEYGFNQMDLPLDDPFGMATQEIKDLNAYVASLTPSRKNGYTGRFAGKNLILITAEAFTKEVIDPELTPTLYRMATKGVQFTDYYQFAGAGTSGGEYQHLFGLAPTSGPESFKMMTENTYNMSIAHQLAAQGYQGAAYHNGESFFYDREQTHTRLGYTDGFLALGNGLEDVLGVEWTGSDMLMFEKTVPTYIDRQPFCCYYMTISAHTPYDYENNGEAAVHREEVADLPYSEPVKGYLASNMELENAMTYLLNALEEKGIADNTVICLTGDHFPYGLDDNAGLGDMPYLSELYGYDVQTVFQRDHNCWLLWCGELEKQAPIVIDSPTCSMDILPTLYNLFGLEFDSRLFPGRDVFSDAPAFVFNDGYYWKTDLGEYNNETDTFTPVSGDVVLPDGYVENMKTVARNKVNFCSSALKADYYGYLFRGLY